MPFAREKLRKDSSLCFKLIFKRKDIIKNIIEQKETRILKLYENEIQIDEEIL